MRLKKKENAKKLTPISIHAPLTGCDRKILYAYRLGIPYPVTD